MKRNSNNNHNNDDGVTEKNFKVLIVADRGIKKTEFIQEIVGAPFYSHYKSTIGIDFRLKQINFDENTVVKLELWDIADLGCLGNMTRISFKGANAAIIICDPTRDDYEYSIKKWMKKIQEANLGEIPIILIGLKNNQPINLPELTSKAQQLIGEDCKAYIVDLKEDNGYVYETSGLNELVAMLVKPWKEEQAILEAQRASLNFPVTDLNSAIEEAVTNLSIQGRLGQKGNITLGENGIAKVTITASANKGALMIEALKKTGFYQTQILGKYSVNFNLDTSIGSFFNRYESINVTFTPKIPELQNNIGESPAQSR